MEVSSSWVKPTYAVGAGVVLALPLPDAAFFLVLALPVALTVLRQRGRALLRPLAALFNPLGSAILGFPSPPSS